MSYHYDPEPPITPPEPKGLTCERCGAVIFSGSDYILWKGESLCMECAAEAVRDELDESGFRFYLDELARMMGFDALEAYGK